VIETKERSLSERICDVLGYEAMLTLCEMFGGDIWKIPQHVPKRLLEERIRQQFSRAMYMKQYPATMKTYQAIAEMNGVSVSFVRNVIRKHANS